MSDGTEHKESLDRFSSYIKERLEDHRMPLDPDGWEVIAGHLKRRKRLRIGWIAASIAAALFVGLLWFSIPSERTELQEVIALQEMLTPTPEEDVVVQPLETATPTSAPIITQLFARKKAAVAEPASHSANTVHAEMQPEETIPSEEQSIKNNEQKEEGTVTAESHPSSGWKKENQTDFAPRKKRTIDRPAHRKSQEGKWLLAAAVGTGGGNLSLQWGVADYTNAPSNDYTSPGNIGSIIPTPPDITHDDPLINPNEYVDASHAIPISVGITLRKDFNRTFAVETGLFYTYLSSDLKKRNINHLNDRLELHYLGVPVNLVGYLVNQPRWNLYLSGGIMLEKGLQAVYTEKGYYSNQIETRTRKSSISGVQFSLNGAIGIAYRIVDHWSLYAEPKLYYYFDADQPISVRTEHPFGFGINAGVRFHF